MDNKRGRGIGAIATKYGLIQGVLSFIVFLLVTMAGIRRSAPATLVNAAILIVLMVIAHREFRKSHDGMMTYPQGLGSGTLLSCVGAVLRCVLTYVYVKYINTGYLADLRQTQQLALERRGVSAAQAQMAMGITAAITSPVGIAVTSLIAGVIAGFIVALIVSIFTQKADPRAVI